ncbi:MAG: hypothetical protein RL082_1106 [Pseudomonadota bacterium]
MPTLMKKIVSVLFALCVITPAIAQSDVGNWPSQRPIKIIGGLSSGWIGGSSCSYIGTGFASGA